MSALEKRRARTRPSPRPKPEYLRTLRLLVETYHAFVHVDTELLRHTGLTQPQFDVVATLGNTPGMAMRTLSERTLIAKGTLTGVVDRLEKKGLVRREGHPEDRRSTLVVLTEEGERVFRRFFSPHIERWRRCFDDLGLDDHERIRASIRAIKERIERCPDS